MDKVKVLVVEDEWITAQDIKRSLEKLDYAVPATIVTGEEAIQKAIEVQPDLVLMDIVLPGEIDGIEAAKQIHRCCNCPVVFLTAYSDAETLQRANATQPYGYLIKPFEDRELNSTIQIALSRHKATVELRSQLAAIVESSEDAIIGKTLDGIIANWNAGAEKIFGYRAEEAIGRSITILLPPNCADEMPKILEKIGRGEKVEPYETVRMRKDGELIDISLSISPIKDATGKVIGASKIAHDITRRKRTEQLVQQQQFLLKNLIEGSKDLIAALDQKFRYITFNSAYKAELFKIFGCHIDIGTSLIEALAHLPEEQAKALELWGRGLSGEEFSIIQEFGDITRDRNYYEITFSSIRDENGQLLGTAQIAKNINTRIRTEKQIQSSLQGKNVLLQEMHHRVKNNLQIVSSFLEMQSRKTPQQEVALVLQDSQSRIASIALVHEKLCHSDNLVNIRFVRYVVDLTGHLFDIYNVSSNTVKLKLDIDNIFLDLDTAIPCGLIINELVANSLKYAFPNNRKGEIEVKFHSNIEGIMTLIVRDNGIGIPDKFDINTASSLGLTVVQGLVEQLEGSLELDRSQGTEFRITFPGNVA
jgi:PAS domain S-box-containing protein